jgi:hypothetical protein
MLTLPRVRGPIRVAVILSTETILHSFIVRRHVTHVTDGWRKIAITLAMHTGVSKRTSNVPQGLKPASLWALDGTAEAVPFPNLRFTGRLNPAARLEAAPFRSWGKDKDRRRAGSCRASPGGQTGAAVPTWALMAEG